MAHRKRSTHLSRLNKSIGDLKPIIRALRPSLRKDFERLVMYAAAGARAYDWLDREKRASTPKSSRASRTKPSALSNQPAEPGDKPGSKKRKGIYFAGWSPNSLEHIPLAERDLARLELLRASHIGASPFTLKRRELMKRFGIDTHPSRNRIMGAFWSHVSGHRRKRFITRLLATSAELGMKPETILRRLVRYYGRSRTVLLSEHEASQTLH